MKNWRDSYNLTLLQKMIIFEQDTDDFRYKMTNTSNMEPMCFLITIIIQNQYFDDDFLFYKTVFDLKTNFGLQHIYDKCPENKTKCSYFEQCQSSILKVSNGSDDGDEDCIKLKRVVKKRKDGGFDEVNGSKNGQIGIITKHKYAVTRSDGTVVQNYSLLKGIREEDGDFAPEHFETDSLHSKSSGGKTVLSKENEYNPVDGASTVYMKIPNLPVFSKHVANHTTLLLLAFKTKKWDICKAILSLDTQKYPSLDKVERGKVMINESEKKIRRRHSLYYTDDSNENCLNIAIESHEIDIC